MKETFTFSVEKYVFICLGYYCHRFYNKNVKEVTKNFKIPFLLRNINMRNRIVFTHVGALNSKHVSRTEANIMFMQLVILCDLAVYFSSL